jgi:predicted ATPase
MIEQPSGTVTLVFTDIEGSTRMLSGLGTERYARALAEHRRLLRAAFARHRGYEVDCEGDAFFVAFESAAEAVAAASETQAELGDGPIRVRMGVHTGEPGLDPPKYVGMDVHLAARVMAAGHGGQVLVTRATRDLLEVELSDLGEHRLKDIDAPVWLYQLGERRFPPLRTLNNTNLPRPSSSLLGREDELAELLGLLRSDEVRLVTLTGPGGTGKTRLALAAAAELVPEFANGVFWVSLGALREPALVLPEIVRVVGAAGGSGSSSVEILQSWLADKRLLLLLDNFEHVLEAAPPLVDLLAAAPQLRLLVTSRAPLRLRGEQEFPVPPLSLPEARVRDPGLLARSGAVALFLARAQALQPGFRLTVENAEAVSGVCRALDGLPLALELAAARLRLFDPQELFARLEQRLDLLGDAVRDLPARQQTLRAAIDWSYRLLEPNERALIRSLAVFAGGCTFAAIEGVYPDGDVVGPLTAVIESSLLNRQQGPEGEPRFSMLETIRAYASEQLLARGEEREPRARHGDYYLTFAETAADKFRHAAPEHERWYARLEHELDNIRAALAWYAETDNEKLVRLAMAASLLWGTGSRRAHLAEGEHWLGLALARSSGESSPRRAYVLYDSSVLAAMAGDHERSRELTEQALAMFRDKGNQAGITKALRSLAMEYGVLGEHEQAEALAEEALAVANTIGDERHISIGLYVVGHCLAAQERFAEALPVLEEALTRLRAIGWDQYVAGTLIAIAVVQLQQEHLQDARANFEQALYLAAEDADCLLGLAVIAARQGQMLQAARQLAASDLLYAETGRTVHPWLPWLLEAQRQLRDSISARVSPADLERTSREIETMTRDEIRRGAIA